MLSDVPQRAFHFAWAPFRPATAAVSHRSTSTADLRTLKSIVRKQAVPGLNNKNQGIESIYVKKSKVEADTMMDRMEPTAAASPKIVKKIINAHRPMRCHRTRWTLRAVKKR